jgi:hypothetical protein
VSTSEQIGEKLISSNQGYFNFKRKIEGIVFPKMPYVK